MSDFTLHPSIMCADYSKLGEEIRLLNQAGAHYFHVDVMDGDFVPNFACGPMTFDCLKRCGTSPIDAHLMVNRPERYIKLFARLGADAITIHPEAGRHTARTLAQIADLGISPGIALNPGTSAETVKELFPLCKQVLAMTVNPGFAGQPFLEFTVEKIKTLGEYAERYGFKLWADGAISRERIKQLRPLGVSGFILGTAALFGLGEYGAIMGGILADT